VYRVPGGGSTLVWGGFGGGIPRERASKGESAALEGVSEAEESAEKVPAKTKSVPQRLKPPCEQSTFGTAEAVPLSKADFFSRPLKLLHLLNFSLYG
jgi:hypothetical protein